MITRDGDLERLGWEVREVDDATKLVLDSVLAYRAAELAEQATDLSEELRMRDEAHSRRFYLARGDRGGFVSIGGMNREPLSMPGIMEALPQKRFPRLHMSRVQVNGELFAAYGKFITHSEHALGSARHPIEGGMSDVAWRLARYQPGAGLRTFRYVKPDKGHFDRLPPAAEVDSIQLTEEPSEWKVGFTDARTGRRHMHCLRQVLGQVVVLRASFWHLPGWSATPYHYVRNPGGSDRLAYLRVRYTGKKPESQRRQITDRTLPHI